MCPTFRSDPFSCIRDEARILVQRADVHEDSAQALVDAAERDVRTAEAALSHTFEMTHECIDDLRSLLCAQLDRSLEGVERARHLRFAACEQHSAARQLLTHLDRDPEIDAPRPVQSPSPHAVLVVDDYGDVRELIATVLRKAGFTVKTAVNGLEGLLTAYEMRPEVIVMDVSMPVLDGIEATRLIKATEATRQARVIAYTGNAMLADRQLFAAVLQKPATPDVVLATVQHFASS
jgi:CheY-like chemotaxis protein